LACPRASDQSGFSLIELTIALAIMGLLGALAMPIVSKIAERTGFSLDLQDLERQLDQLPQVAASQGHGLILTSSPTADDPVPLGTVGDPYPVKLPQGWQITVDTPILYRYDGTCGGGRLHLTTPSSEANYLMRPPLCELRPG
jgi:prepilin-type N-terminal cleavage/methylation domain-containing protein